MLVISYLGLKTPNHNMMIREWPSFQTHLLMSGCEGLAQHVRVPTRLGKPGIWKWSWKIEKVMGKSSFCRWIAKISVLRRVADKSTWSQKGLNISVCLSWLKNGHGNKTKITRKSHGFISGKGWVPCMRSSGNSEMPYPWWTSFFLYAQNCQSLRHGCHWQRIPLMTQLRRTVGFSFKIEVTSGSAISQPLPDWAWLYVKHV